jgi:ribonuclease T2
MKTELAAAALCLALLSASSAWAKAEFTASEACEAYISTKHLSNPDDAKLEAGKSYPVLKSNRPTNPEWYLLRLDSANPTDRWVKTECGKMAVLGNKAPAPGAACSIAAQADGYVFAVSWQPAFCESKPDKPECSITDAKAYQATHFTLHGLWPNKTSCGTNYGYCAEVKTKPANFCDYPPVSLSPEVKTKLAEVMPSVSSNSCLERHEWHKHGTCQSSTANEYYERATALVRQFNDSGISQFISSRIGQTVSLEEFRTAMDADLGAGASKRAKIGCSKDGLLVDIYINLPAELKPDASLKELIAQAPEASADNSCKNGFRVDAIGQ